jgi:hypothetical protein
MAAVVASTRTADIFEYLGFGEIWSGSSGGYGVGMRESGNGSFTLNRRENIDQRPRWIAPSEVLKRMFHP